MSIKSPTQQRMYKCIWCQIEKEEGDFNVEHVMPQSFGTFEQNFTLINTVCAECNSLFAKDLEPWLARDSLEGFDRFRYGTRPPSDFKSLGARSTSRVQLSEGPYAGAWGFSLPGEEQLNSQLFPQIGFAKADSTEFEWFPLDALPSKEELKAKGYAGLCNIRSCECDLEEARQELLAKGIDYDLRDTIEPAQGGTWIDQVFRPSLFHQRALAKIAVNYVAKHFGPGGGEHHEF